MDQKNPQLAAERFKLAEHERNVHSITIEEGISRAQIIDPSTLSGERIIFGATVTLLDEDDKPVKYQIVGPYEADARLGRISYASPLGKALIGRRVEDEIEVTVPSGDKFYLVKKLEFI